jgi:hypothetical protein
MNINIKPKHIPYQSQSYTIFFEQSQIHKFELTILLNKLRHLFIDQDIIELFPLLLMTLIKF